MSSLPSSQFETAVMIRRILFFLVLVSFTLLHLLPLFRGLDSPQAMEQAQIGRQFARGEGLTTKMIRPLAYYEAEQANGGAVDYTKFKDTYHAPLNPLIMGVVLKLAGADKDGAWPMGKNEQVYPLDRVIALVSTLFFLVSIGVTYLLVGRIFDAKIAGVTAVLMLLCDLMWKFSQSGLPQMLLMMLFSCALYFTYRAVEATEEGKTPFGHALAASFFLVLMVLSHWITAWIFLGFLVFAAIAFRPRGLVALSGLAMLAIALAWPLMRASDFSGQPFGTALYVLYNGLGNGTEASIMRNHDLQSASLSLDGLMMRILGTTLVQISELLPFLGGILAAPLFFVALLHPFKRTSIASFRWAIVLMWLFAALGMAVFGINRTVLLHPNQIHILFAPVMAAYGLAFISILWSRLEAVNSVPYLRNVHYVAVILLSAAPMLMSIPDKVKLGMWVRDRGYPHWPPYLPSVLNQALPKLVAPSEDEKDKVRVVVSDQPWAVAWYADEISLWLPKTKRGFEKMEDQANALGTPFGGIMVSPSSTTFDPAPVVRDQYGEFASMIFNGLALDVTAAGANRVGISIMDKDPKLSDIVRRYPHLQPLAGTEILYYGERRAETAPNP
ncbi:glycosyltransferase family 39 protein [Luteolibacter flavescens]|uniref:Glycosyltransferase family 39 protein n=1 Tax=Luteolibacter flavescens TaxID=1859460 RepID=A0ABT3FLZ1_9BACT|nr:glycosyltransferase family 39 protein [Luteolibacter flavescens]MCW1884578.1 glycosyltransferase family 39 protein [Luteolibacter flavescens]